MRPALALTILVLQAAFPGSQQPQQPLGSIEGIVLRADNGEPLAKAQVNLTRMVTPPPQGQTPATPVTPPPQIPPVLTDAEGKFVFKDLAPASYRVIASKNGFVRNDFGARTTGGAGAPVSLAAGQTLKDVTFRLVQTAAVSGRVRTTTGEPGAALAVQLMRTNYTVNGQRTFQTVSSGRTDDRGEYRLFWVNPGRYFLSIAGGRNSTIISLLEGGTILTTALGADTSTSNPATVYYPGTTDPSRATTIEVGPGGELTNIDVLLPQQLSYRVSGRVIDAATGLPPRTVSITLVPRDPGSGGLTTSVPPNYNAADGTFDMRDVPPGSYWIRAQTTQSTTAAVITPNAVGRTISEALSMSTAAGRMIAQQPLDVVSDVDNVVLELGAGFSIPGTLRVEGAPLPATPGPRVSLRPTSPNFLAPPLLPIDADGTFTLNSVTPGEYRVTVLGMPVDYYVKEAKIDLVDVLNSPWAISGPVRGVLNVVVSSGAAQVEGTVIDSKLQPVAALQTVLIPDQNRDRSELIRTAMTDQNGKFTLRGITPGSYKIFAWEGLEPNAYFDPEVLRQYENHGKPVRVTEGGKIVTDVTTIPVRE